MLEKGSFRKMILVAGIMFVVIISLIFTACVDDGALVGRWRDRNNDWTIEFYKNGKGVLNDDDKFIWSAANGRLTITMDNETEVNDYSISGSSLTIHGRSHLSNERVSLWRKLGN